MFQCKDPVLYIPSTYLINQSGIPADIIPGYLEAAQFTSKLSTTLKVIFNVAFVTV